MTSSVLPGGPADKIGNRYEGRWTVRCMLQILNGEAVEIRLEDPGDLGRGVEFWLTRQDQTEFHQTKRQHPEGNWTLSRLVDVRVLATFQEKLLDPDACCVFASGCSAFPLEGLAERARNALSWEEYQDPYLRGGAEDDFNALCEQWTRFDRPTVFEALRRTWICPIGESMLKKWNEERAAATVAGGPPATVTAVLADFALNQVHQRLSKEAIWKHLQDVHHLAPRVPDPEQAGRVEASSRQYAVGQQLRAVNDTVIARPEGARATAHLRDSDGPKAVLVAGEAGSGKSMLLAQIVEEHQSDGWPVLTVRFDQVTGSTPEDIGAALDVEGSPTTALAAIADGRDCLIVFDQLDALALANRRPQLFDAVDAMLTQAMVHPNMSVLLACRKYDLDNDGRLMGLIGQREGAIRIELGRLDFDTVRAALTSAGLDGSPLNATQLEVLSLPLNLSLLTEAAPAWRDELDFASEHDLTAKWVEYKRGRHG